MFQSTKRILKQQSNPAKTLDLIAKREMTISFLHMYDNVFLA